MDREGPAPGSAWGIAAACFRTRAQYETLTMTLSRVWRRQRDGEARAVGPGPGRSVRRATRRLGDGHGADQRTVESWLALGPTGRDHLVPGPEDRLAVHGLGDVV